LVEAQLESRGITEFESGARAWQRCALFKDRCATVVELADWLAMYAIASPVDGALRTAHLTDAVRPAIGALAAGLAACEWTKPGIAQAFKDTLATHGLKMPQLATPVRVLVCGRAQTPSVDAVLALFDRQAVLDRLKLA
jgi:glutamyl-tRNA synthetase